ncbi:hypothetical protein C8R43DRAFT_519972 [Mycena crocata]|nr:hypothetical protein C8R43DRAFT_519972 [Mycena crocata]
MPRERQLAMSFVSFRIGLSLCVVVDLWLSIHGSYQQNHYHFFMRSMTTTGSMVYMYPSDHNLDYFQWDTTRRLVLSPESPSRSLIYDLLI